MKSSPASSRKFKLLLFALGVALLLLALYTAVAGRIWTRTYLDIRLDGIRQESRAYKSPGAIAYLFTVHDGQSTDTYILAPSFRSLSLPNDDAFVVLGPIAVSKDVPPAAVLYESNGKVDEPSNIRTLGERGLQFTSISSSRTITVTW